MLFKILKFLVLPFFILVLYLGYRYVLPNYSKTNKQVTSQSPTPSQEPNKSEVEEIGKFSEKTLRITEYYFANDADCSSPVYTQDNLLVAGSELLDSKNLPDPDAELLTKRDLVMFGNYYIISNREKLFALNVEDSSCIMIDFPKDWAKKPDTSSVLGEVYLSGGGALEFPTSYIRVHDSKLYVYQQYPQMARTEFTHWRVDLKSKSIKRYEELDRSNPQLEDTPERYEYSELVFPQSNKKMSGKSIFKTETFFYPINSTKTISRFITTTNEFYYAIDLEMKHKENYFLVHFINKWELGKLLAAKNIVRSYENGNSFSDLHFLSFYGGNNPVTIIDDNKVKLKMIRCKGSCSEPHEYTNLLLDLKTSTLYKAND